MKLRSLVFVIVFFSFFLLACNNKEGADSNNSKIQIELPMSPTPVIPPDNPTPKPDAIFSGAGDIVRCGNDQSEATAKLLDGIPGDVFTVGDNSNESGTQSQYQNCYDKTWGRHKQRTHPTIGNHDLETANGAPYFAYFGELAGPLGLGYYSFTLGAWHIVSLNSMISAKPGSPQYEWLRSDLIESKSSCVLAMWHYPLFSSGPNGPRPEMKDIWRLLNEYGTEIVLNGHDHVYERFAPQDADGKASQNGIRQFTVGTGGYSLYYRARSQPNSEVFEDHTWGVLKLTLKSTGYDWEFVPIVGHSFRDFGSGNCSINQVY